MKHSGLGIASFIITVLGGLLAVAMVAASVVLASANYRDDSIQFVIVGLFLFASVFLMLVGLGLGIAGVCIAGRKKVFAILGIVFSTGGILCLGALMLIGALAE